MSGTKKKIDLLTKSKHFCMMPWVHMHAFADGRVYPCCFADTETPLGSLRSDTMEQVWNNEKYCKLRQNMLNDQPSEICNKCYDQEQNGIFSLRQSINSSHKKYIGDIDLTNEDGTHPEFKLKYWDIRFSNLCNFSCRTCGPVFSSNWFKEHVQMYGKKPVSEGRELNVVEYAGRSKYDILEQMEHHLPYIDQIYFAGGEPLIMEEHYLILEKLIELGKTDINLQYNTNFSELSYKNKNVLDLWKHFSNVSVGASLDAMGDRAELMRRGTDWQKIEANRQEMIARAPHVDFYISATLSIMNSIHIVDLHRDWVEKGLIQARDFDVNVLYSPEWYRIDVLPEKFKYQVVKPLYEKHIQWLSEQEGTSRATSGFQGALGFLTAKDNSDKIESLLAHISSLDRARNEDFFSVFPELRILKGNDTLCILPWISLETTPIGTARPCCLAEDEITDSDGKKFDLNSTPLQTIYNSDYMVNLRKQFRNGEQPDTCKKCWVEEAAGRTSKRMNTLIKFKESIKDVPLHQDAVDDVWFLDLKLGNICNLKCRICGSWSSSKWSSEELEYYKSSAGPIGNDQLKFHTAYQMLKKGNWPRTSKKFWNSLHEILPGIRYMEFTGGEPFLIAEHIELLKFAADNDYAKNISLHYNTNGTVYPTELESIWKQFKQVEIAFSIDNVDKKFEYERFGADWVEVNQNIKRFELLRLKNRNISLQLCFTVNLLNVLYLNQLLQWSKTINFDSLHWNMLHGPEELSIASIPEDLKQYFIDYINSIDFLPEYQNEINNVIRMIENGTPVELEYIHEKIKTTDLYRKQHLSETHTELARLLKYE